MGLEAPALCVSRSLGEEARRRLRRLGLLRRDLKPRVAEGKICFPLTRPIGPGEAAELGGVPRTMGFEPRKTMPRSLREYLEERLGGGAPRITSYYLVGDIAVITLTSEVKRYARLVGEAIARVQRSVRAVYAKEAVRGEHRVPRLIHLYGEQGTETIYRENGLSFYVDIASMYVNPSLATEHLRVARLCRDGERVLDMFTGFGGFPINIAAHRRVEAVAVDINPAALEALRKSLSMNRLRGLVEPVQADSSLLDRMIRPGFTRIIMNLPHRSLSFMKTACILASTHAWIHVYLVAGSPEEALGKVGKAAAEAGCPSPRTAGARRVVDYAPYTYIYAVDLQLGSRATRTN